MIYDPPRIMTIASPTKHTIQTVLIFVLAPSPKALGHELAVDVVGKGASTYQIPEGPGDSFFLVLRGIRGSTEDEIEFQITDQFSEASLYYLDVQPDMHISLEGTGSPGFDIDIRALGFAVGGNYDCGFWCGVDFDISTDYLNGVGNVNYDDGSSSFSIESVNLNVNADGQGLWGTIADIFGITDQLEDHVESTLEDELQINLFETEFLGLSDILADLPSGVITATGIDPYDLLENPFEGLILDIAFFEPQPSVWSGSGTIDITISHSPVTGVLGSAVDDGFGLKSPQLSWSPTPNISSYRVFRKSHTEPQWTECANITTTQWTDNTVHANLTPKVNHPPTQEWTAYHVVAENHLGIRSISTVTWYFGANSTGWASY